MDEVDIERLKDATEVGGENEGGDVTVTDLKQCLLSAKPKEILCLNSS
jgi:hypothetical protein